MVRRRVCLDKVSASLPRVKFLRESASAPGASGSEHYVATWDEHEMAAAELSLRRGTEMRLRTMPENMVLPALFRWDCYTHSSELEDPGPIILGAVWDTWDLQAVFNGVQQPGPSPSSTGGYSAGPPPPLEVDGPIEIPFLLPSGSVQSTMTALNSEHKPNDSRALFYSKRNGFAVMWSKSQSKYYLLWRGDKVVHWDNIKQTLERFGVHHTAYTYVTP